MQLCVETPVLNKEKSQRQPLFMLKGINKKELACVGTADIFRDKVPTNDKGSTDWYKFF